MSLTIIIITIFLFFYRGMFFDGHLFHYIENIEHDSGEKYHLLYKHDDLRTNYTCGKLSGFQGSF